MLQGYRTYIAAGLMALFSALSIVDWNVFMADPKAGAWGLIVSIVMIVMRTITTTPPAVPATTAPPVSNFVASPPVKKHLPPYKKGVVSKKKTK